MAMPGRLVPEYPVADIDQTGVFRRDVGDIDDLAASMKTLGLLTPIITTSDGNLISGKRRLDAAARLGWQQIPVWIPDKVSEMLRLRATCEDQLTAKPLTPSEQAVLYTEYRQLFAAEAQLRQQASQFKGKDEAGGTSVPDMAVGVGTSPTPLVEPVHVREKAAIAVTGVDAHQRLERISELQQIAADEDQDPFVQQQAAQALVEIDGGGKVTGAWQRIKLAQHLAVLDQAAADPRMPDTVRQQAAQCAEVARDQADLATAVKRAKAGVDEITCSSVEMPATVAPQDPHAAQHRQIRELAGLLRREHGWWDRYDPDMFARFADDDQWELVESYASGMNNFWDKAAALRVRDGV